MIDGETVGVHDIKRNKTEKGTLRRCRLQGKFVLSLERRGV